MIPPPLGPRSAGRLADADRGWTADRNLAGDLGQQIRRYMGAVEDGDILDEVVAEVRPEAIVHYAEQPSAPYSMMSRESAVETQDNN